MECNIQFHYQLLLGFFFFFCVPESRHVLPELSLNHGNCNYNGTHAGGIRRHTATKVVTGVVGTYFVERTVVMVSRNGIRCAVICLP
jgi:hypothetical protein